MVATTLVDSPIPSPSLSPSLRIPLSHSHLQPGHQASILTYPETLKLYRENAKKTEDPAILLDFARFLIGISEEQKREDSKTASVRSSSSGRSSRRGSKIFGNESIISWHTRGSGSTGSNTSGSSPHSPSNSSFGSSTPPPSLPVLPKLSSLLAEAHKIMRRLVARHPEASFELAEMYEAGSLHPNGKREFAKALPLYLQASKHGITEACYRVAVYYENGKGVTRNKERATSFYRKAAASGHPGALHRIGMAELHGELGLVRSPRDGFKWLNRAAANANPSYPTALYDLSILHERGVPNVVYIDESYALTLLIEASSLNHPPSQFKLGLWYEKGREGVCAKDERLSVEYYKAAWMNGEPEAGFRLAGWYLTGARDVLPQSDNEAFAIMRQAAEMGCIKAMYALGYFYEQGVSTDPSDESAKEWYELALYHGDTRAEDRIREIVGRNPELQGKRKNNEQGSCRVS